MHTHPFSLQTPAAGGRALRIDFMWQGDRFAHRLAVDQPGGLLPLIDSVEGTAEEHWPASPPLQQLSIQQQPDGSPAALLVGMAGRSHWSASVTRAGVSLLFDIACRVVSNPKRLGSEYRTSLKVWQTADGVTLKLGDFCVKVSPLAAELEGLSRVEATPSGIAVRAPTLQRTPPSTLRWKYRVAIGDE